MGTVALERARLAVGLVIVAAVARLVAAPAPCAAADSEPETLAQRLAAGLEADAPSLAALLRGQPVRIERQDAPLFRRHQLYTVTRFLPTRPVVFRVALDPDSGRVVALTAAPAAFAAVTRAEAVAIRSEADAVAHARAFLTITAPTGRRYLLVERPDDVPLPGGGGDELRAAREAARERLAALVTPLSATRADEGYEVSAHVLDDRTLRLVRLAVGPSGAIEPVGEGRAELELPLPATH